METARMIDELAKAFNKANKKWYEGKLPTPMIIVSRKTSKWELGFITTSKIWKEKINEESEEATKEIETRYEINISAEGLGRPLVEILTTLVHEVVHEYNLVNDIKDCSGKIHNKHFKREAERVGLIVEKGTGVGYGHTSPSEDFKKEVETWGIDESVFSFVRMEVFKPTALKKGGYKYTLPSDPKKKFKCKFEVQVIEPDTGECYDREYEPGDDE